jgi:hypothetical protein
MTGSSMSTRERNILITLGVLLVIVVAYLALLWQIFSHDRGGWDSRISFSVTHGWSAFGRADHGRRKVELGR